MLKAKLKINLSLSIFFLHLIGNSIDLDLNFRVIYIYIYISIVSSEQKAIKIFEKFISNKEREKKKISPNLIDDVSINSFFSSKFFFAR